MNDPAEVPGLASMAGGSTVESAPAEGDRLSAAARRARHLGQSSILLILMLLAAIGGLYLLSGWEGPERASAEMRTAELQVDTALARLGVGAEAGRHTDVKALVDGFYGQAKERQIPMTALARNPFFQQVVRTAPQAVVAPVKKPTPAQTRVAQQAQDALKEVRALRLQSVLIGEEQTSAIISNNLLTVGQEIRGWTVAEIEPRKVVLTNKQYTHELELPK